MPEVTRLLDGAAGGDKQAAAAVLPLVIDELRKLAAGHLAREAPGQTLTATALVHEAYLRLVASPGRESADEGRWDGRGHFFAAAAEAMRRLLIDRARARLAAKRGAGRPRADVDLDRLPAPMPDDQLLDFDSALERLAAADPAAADVARLHVYGGLSVAEAGEALGQSRAAAYRNWTFARAWLRDALGGEAFR
jgi:RNA polymerase sigma factor (TIGR02999 family)